MSIYGITLPWIGLRLYPWPASTPARPPLCVRAVSD